MKEKKVADKTFYNLMGVNTNVTPEELKKAYRKKALQLHPDKRGNSAVAQEEFTVMKHAYDVLSDPQKKEIYDQFGEQGVKMIENFGEVSPTDMMTTMISNLGTRGKLSLFAAMASIIGFFMLTPIFACLRIDLTISWSWALVMIPVWIINALVFCCIGLSSNSTDDEDQEEEDRSKMKQYRKVYNFFRAILFLTTQIFVVLRLNQTIDWNMFLVLAPYFVFEFTIFLAKCYHSKATLDTFEATASPENTRARRALYITILASYWMTVWRLALVCLVAMRIDDTITVSWWIVLLPLWIHFGVCILKLIQAYRLSAHQAQEQSDEEKAPSKAALVCEIIGLGIICSPFFILASRLQSGDFSSFYVVLPWLIIVGLFVLLLACGTCALGAVAEQSNEEDEGVVSSEEKESESPYGSINNQV